VITVSNSSIGSIQQSVDQLNTKLNTTNKQLVNLQNQLTTTNVVLNKTGETLSNSVNQAKSSIDTDINSLRDASGQLNSIILPILALISVIIALQISLFARIRASYK
jgi:ABC-type transporter Mla subunit MlaD